MKVLVQLLDGAVLPQRQTRQSFGYDLANHKVATLIPHETQLVGTGVTLPRGLPPDVAMMILPRSSLLLKWGLVLGNAPGLIDADYVEEIKLVLHNLDRITVTIPAGTRLAQAVFVSMRLPELAQVYELKPQAPRGGFGSTDTQNNDHEADGA